MTAPVPCPHLPHCPIGPDGSQAQAHALDDALGTLRALTLDQRTVGLGALADAAFGSGRAAALHASLHARGIESLVLATCNRTELYWRTRRDGDDGIVAALFAEAIGSAVVPRRLQGTAAADHLFRVCCGLESLVVGEAEILGQVRTALETCTGAGPFLAGIVRAALRTGRVARAETAIGVGAMSVASAAVRLLASHLTIADSRVLVIGAGATGLKAARHLKALGVRGIVLANRTRAHAETRARELGATPLGLDAIADALPHVDAVVGAAGAPHVLVTAAMLAAAVRARRGRPLVTVDLAMPPVIDAGALDGIVRLDLQAIEHHVAAQRDRRLDEVPRVEVIVAREIGFLQAWARQQALRPLIADLRRKIEGIRQGELARIHTEVGPGAGDEVLDRLSRRIVDQVLALPTASLEGGGVALDPLQTQLVRRLFALG